MVLQCYHHAYNDNTTTCTGGFNECARIIDCPADQHHCFAVYELVIRNATITNHDRALSEDGNHTNHGYLSPNGVTSSSYYHNIISASCSPKFDLDECNQDCSGKKRGQLYYCCCNANNCNKTPITPIVPAQQPTIHQPTASPIRPIPSQSSNSFELTWIIIIAAVFVITIVVGTFVRRKTSKRFNGNSGSGGGGAGHVEDARTRHHGNGPNNLQTTDSKLYETNNLNGREMNELGVNSRNIALILPVRNSPPMHDGQHRAGSGNLDGDNPMGTSPARTHNINNSQQQQHQKLIKIEIDDVKLFEIVGSGRFGTVHRATIERQKKQNDTVANPTDGNIDAADQQQSSSSPDDDILGCSEIAVKIIHANERQSWLNELQIYSFPKTRHTNILGFLGSCQHIETDCYWLLVEYASKGSLHHYLKANTISWDECLNISLGIVHGLSHLHDADIAHRDFKSKNVLLKHDMTPCITDFGVASMLDNSSGSQTEQRRKYLQVGTPRYMAPEVLECSVTFTKTSFTKIDVYALSLVLWELTSRIFPLPRPQSNDGVVVVGGGGGGDEPSSACLSPEERPLLAASRRASSVNPDDIELQHEQSEGQHQEQARQPGPPPYMMPFEDVVGSNPDINTMRQIVVCEKLRPPIRDEWNIHPLSKFCQAIVDGWEYDEDARISASCFVERIEGLHQRQQQYNRHQQHLVQSNNHINHHHQHHHHDHQPH